MSATSPARGGTDRRAGVPPALEVEHVTVALGSQLRFGRRAERDVLTDVSLRVARGEIVGLVGESGCGKSTLARTIVGLLQPRQGNVRVGGVDVHAATGAERRGLRRRVQIVFQDVSGSLPPHLTAGAAIDEALAIDGVDRAERRRRVAELLDLVELPDNIAGRRPSQLSGGQAQRVAIARALAVGPQVLVADESVTALDTVVQAKVLDLLDRLRDDLGIGCLFIAHDLAVVARIADRVAVMDAGRIVECGTTANVFGDPSHDQTRRLLAAIPRLPH
jgi:peptide/nickel transport system ATP-binding protein